MISDLADSVRSGRSKYEYVVRYLYSRIRYMSPLFVFIFTFHKSKIQKICRTVYCEKLDGYCKICHVRNDTTSSLSLCNVDSVLAIPLAHE